MTNNCGTLGFAPTRSLLQDCFNIHPGKMRTLMGGFSGSCEADMLKFVSFATGKPGGLLINVGKQTYSMPLCYYQHPKKTSIMKGNSDKIYPAGKNWYLQRKHPSGSAGLYRSPIAIKTGMLLWYTREVSYSTNSFHAKHWVMFVVDKVGELYIFDSLITRPGGQLRKFARNDELDHLAPVRRYYPWRTIAVREPFK